MPGFIRLNGIFAKTDRKLYPFWIVIWLLNRQSRVSETVHCIANKADAEAVKTAIAVLQNVARRIEREREQFREEELSPSKIRAVIETRAHRNALFGPNLFADPAWDIFLELLLARLEGRRITVSSLCMAAAVPTTTALRWINLLAEVGWLEREKDREDSRRVFLTLTESTAKKLKQLFAFSDGLVGL